MYKPEPNWKAGDIAVVKPEYDEAGLHLKVLGPPFFHEQWWLPVIHPMKEDPTFYKEYGLFKEKT